MEKRGSSLARAGPAGALKDETRVEGDGGSGPRKQASEREREKKKRTYMYVRERARARRPLHGPTVARAGHPHQWARARESMCGAGRGRERAPLERVSARALLYEYMYVCAWCAGFG